ncbi:hypothetical protein J6590_037255 [Homalodisca vitripennis]|nr:hypothetical protein J6590_037255 [Homalodisca vitripennis]
MVLSIRQEGRSLCLHPTVMFRISVAKTDCTQWVAGNEKFRDDKSFLFLPRLEEGKSISDKRFASLDQKCQSGERLLTCVGRRGGLGQATGLNVRRVRMFPPQLAGWSLLLLEFQIGIIFNSFTLESNNTRTTRVRRQLDIQCRAGYHVSETAAHVIRVPA